MNTESADGQMGGQSGGGGEGSVRKDRKESWRQDILRKPAAEAGASGSPAPEGTDARREGEEETEINSVRTGFIPPGPQNWAGPRRESQSQRRKGV